LALRCCPGMPAAAGRPIRPRRGWTPLDCGRRCNLRRGWYRPSRCLSTYFPRRSGRGSTTVAGTCARELFWQDQTTFCTTCRAESDGLRVVITFEMLTSSNANSPFPPATSSTPVPLRSNSRPKVSSSQRRNTAHRNSLRTWGVQFGLEAPAREERCRQ